MALVMSSGNRSFTVAAQHRAPYVKGVLGILVASLGLLAASPESLEEQGQKAAAARNAGRPDEALDIYRSALTGNPRWVDGWWQFATLLYDLERYGEAVPAFERSIELLPKAGTPWVMLGMCEVKLGRPREALGHIRKGRELGMDPDPQFRSAVLYNEGMSLLETGDFDAGQTTLGKLAADGGMSEDVTLALGMSILRIRPSNLPRGSPPALQIIVRAGSAEHLAARGKTDEAAREYAGFIAEHSGVRNGQYAYGRFLLAANQEQEAIGAFKKELENTPNHVLARLALAETGIRFDLAGARQYAEEAVLIAPEIPLGHYLLGELLLKHGELDKAIAELERARTTMPHESRIHWALARAYSQTGRAEEAASARATVARLKQAEEAARQPPVSKP